MPKLTADQAPWLTPPYRSQEQYKDFTLTSRYLEMRDGVRIAIDLYLPKDLEKETRLPTILYQTRYYRRFVYNRLVRGYMKRRDDTLQMFQEFVRNGYAVVCLDVRGTGASFGSRQMEFSPDEIMDGSEVVNWITQQDWSSGIVGTVGTSYTGTTAEFILSTQNPAIKAAVVRYANFDAYSDAICPGGVQNTGFMMTWSKFNRALDNDQLSKFLTQNVGRLAGFAIRGMAPVDEDLNRSQLDAAVQEHAANYDIYEASKSVSFSDDTSDSQTTAGQLSTYSRLAEINATGVPVYCWSSWFDGGFTHAAIKRFLNIESPGSRLILGPWDHGGGQNPDPNNSSNKTYFDHMGEVLRFLDHHLKGTRTGIDRDPPVRYFTMGEGAWKSSDTWPPVDFKPIHFYCAPANSLSLEKPTQLDDCDVYIVDDSTTSGKASRWVSLVNVAQVDIGYPDRKKQDQKLLVYQTRPLSQPLEVTGHPLVTLYLRTQSEDAQLFVYLEDVNPRGKVLYVTEGQFRAIHGETSAIKPPYRMCVPYHSFTRADSRNLNIGEVARVSFDLQPVSYLFAAGHSIRIAIAGADLDNFSMGPDNALHIEVLREQKHSSNIQLPARWR